MICPPHSQIGPVTPAQRAATIASSVVAGVYETAIDRESAYEKLKGKVVASATVPLAPGAPAGAAPAAAGAGSGWLGSLEGVGSAIGGILQSPSGSRRGDTVVQAMVKSAARTMGSTVGRQIIRGVLGSLLGGSKR